MQQASLMASHASLTALSDLAQDHCNPGPEERKAPAQAKSKLASCAEDEDKANQTKSSQQRPPRQKNPKIFLNLALTLAPME